MAVKKSQAKPAKAPRPPRGPHNAHIVTDTTRAQVSVLAACGIKHDVIGSLIGISGDTLRRHYANELDNGGDILTARVANSVYEKALSDRPDAVNAAKFLLQAKSGWTEKTVVENQGEMKLEVTIVRQGGDA